LVLWAAAAGGQSPRRAANALAVAAGEPKTFNPLTAADQPSRDVIYAISADLVHINRATLRTEPALAKSWTVSRDGRNYTLTLRDGLRFSDGAPLTADDVVFTFQAHLDPKTGSPQRDLLLLEGRPIAVRKLGPQRVQFDLPAPYGPAERLFDSFWILPRHKLGKALEEGRLAQAWNTGTPPAEIVTAGPFRLRQFQAGQRVILERNPHYWKKDGGRALPYLDRLELVVAADQNAHLLRLIAGEVDAVPRLRAEDFDRLQQQGPPALALQEGGGTLEVNFLFFNWNAPAPAGNWFRDAAFRRAVAHAIDRESIVRLVYSGRAAVIWSPVTLPNSPWRSDQVARYSRDTARAERLLREAGFRRQGSGPLLDAGGRPVEFTIMASASNLLRRKIATLIQDDLAGIGIRAQALPTEFGAMMDAVRNTRKFEAAVFGIGLGDADPNTEMGVWPSGGSLHFWDRPAPGATVEPWQAEIDRQMRAQLTAVSFARRKAAYDRVQQLLAEHLPVIFLASPKLLTAAHRDLEGWTPSAIEPVLLWNCERFGWRR
jgi:peptide/nickel transport system substrate-binding protein